MGVVGSRARRVLHVGVLQPYVSIAKRIDACSSHAFAFHLSAQITDQAFLLRRGGRHFRDPQQIDLELRADVGDIEDPFRVADRIEQLLARACVVAADRSHGCPVDAFRQHTLRSVGALCA